MLDATAEAEADDASGVIIRGLGPCGAFPRAFEIATVEIDDEKAHTVTRGSGLFGAIHAIRFRGPR